MPGNYKKDDLRIIKTCKALNNALLSLLSRQKFAKITVNDVCTEALVSRAAFYSHYRDKYDLLEQCLDDVGQRHITGGVGSSARREQTKQFYVYAFLQQSAIIGNLLDSSDRELQQLLARFMSKTVNCSSSSVDPLCSEFAAGGLLSVALAHISNARRMDAQHIESAVEYLLSLAQAVFELDVSRGDYNG